MAVKSKTRASEVAAVTLLGRKVQVKLNPLDERRGYRLVYIDADKFDRLFAREENFYIGKGGAGGNAIGSRYVRFQEFAREAKSIDVSSASVSKDGSVGFTDGRHRYAVMRDAGVKAIPVAMTPDSIRNARARGLIVESLSSGRASTQQGAGITRRIADATIGHKIDLLRYANGVVRSVQSLLRGVEQDMERQLIAALDRMASSSFSVRRLDEVLSGVYDLSRNTYGRMSLRVENEMRDLSEYELGFQRRMFTSVLPEGVQVRTPNIQAAFAATIARPFQGRLMEEWFASLSDRQQTRLRATIAMGFVEGKTVDEMIKDVRGTRANNFKDGILNVGKRDAEAVVRTAVAHTAAVARDEFYSANEDIIQAEQWLSTLDSRTTEACQIRDGLRYTSVHHDPIGHDVPWGAGPGEIHWNCRSVSIPVINEAVLGVKLPPLERAAQGAPTSAETTYGEWLQRQSPARQDEIVGATRGKLMREGSLPFDRLFQDDGTRLTLDQLRKRESAAFRRADL